MLKLQQALRAAHAALQRGELNVARQTLKGFKEAKAIHLLALVEKADGNFAQSQKLFERAAAADPLDAEIANNQGVLAGQLGQLQQAETEFRRALKLQPTFLQAGTGLGRLLIDQERWRDAADVYDRLMAIAPENTLVRFGYATVQLALGAVEQAAELFDAIIAAGDDRADIRFMRGRARLELGDINAGLDDLRHAHAAAPNELSLKTLAATLWMNGDKQSFEQLLTTASSDPALLITAAEIFRQSGDTTKALDLVSRARSRQDLLPQISIVTAAANIDDGNAVAAENAARDCLDVDADNRVAKGSLISALLMQGKADQALDITLPMRVAEPNGQHWIAYEVTALRILGSSQYSHLLDPERFIRSYELPVPEGFSSLDAFNTAFLQALERCQPYQARPLDQTLIKGIQTPRDLATIKDPTIHAYIAALDDPIRRYMREVGSGEDHPLTRRNTGNYRIAGCWSVRLHGGGHHVNHVHPEGWISSAYYASVPGETESGDDHAGWIKFGEPPFATEPPTPPEKWLQPRAGLLVLFPSFLWHGTKAINAGSVRVTAPFDVVPTT